MVNMGYCLFQNTRIGMEDCLDTLRSYCRENKVIELTKEEDDNDGDE